MNECPTPCDDDCEVECHEWHQPTAKRDHHAGSCNVEAREVEVLLREQLIAEYGDQGWDDLGSLRRIAQMLAASLAQTEANGEREAITPALLRREARKRGDTYVHVATVRNLMRRLANHMDDVALYQSNAPSPPEQEPFACCENVPINGHSQDCHNYVPPVPQEPLADRVEALAAKLEREALAAKGSCPDGACGACTTGNISQMLRTLLLGTQEADR